MIYPSKILDSDLFLAVDARTRSAFPVIRLLVRSIRFSIFRECSRGFTSEGDCDRRHATPRFGALGMRTTDTSRSCPCVVSRSPLCCS